MKFTDALYGSFTLDIDKSVLCSPELQRLRDIRLCNINSPYITGGTSLNRFEHSIGTAYLASNIVNAHSADSEERKAFVLAALLHDIVTAPFGHSLEYLFEALKSKHYEHANIHKMYLTGQTVPSSKNIYYGLKLSIEKALGNSLTDIVCKILNRESSLSLLLDNLIDIDNIDNVFRFAYHIGIPFNAKSPIVAAQHLRYVNKKLIIDSEQISVFEEWYNIRFKLYKYLLEDPGEFVAKALLERIFIYAVENDIVSEYDWILTDNCIIDIIYKAADLEHKKIIRRLMTMNFPSNYKLYSSNDYRIVDEVLNKNKISIINSAYEENVFVHFIRDVNKTCRPLHVNIIGATDEVAIGSLNDRYLIGFFSDEVKALNKSIESVNERLGGSLDLLHNTDCPGSQYALF